MRFPVAPLLARVDSVGDLARLVGVTRRTVHRKLHTGLLPHDADRWALAFGVTPWEVWGDWGSPWCPSIVLPAPAAKTPVWAPSWTAASQCEPWGSRMAEPDPDCMTQAEWYRHRSIAFLRRHSDDNLLTEEPPAVGAMRLA